jgi:sugar phosphate isomerase/epimerase
MITPAFYFEVASRNVGDWLRERDAYSTYRARWFEVLMEYPYTFRDMSSAEIAELRQILQNYSLSYHGATINLSLLALSDKIVSATTEILMQQLDVAKELGSRLFTFHAGEHAYFLERVAGPRHRILTANLQSLLKKAATIGCEVCVENLKNKNTYPRTIREMDCLFSECPDLRLALDIRHACTSGEDPCEMVRLFATQLRSVHFRADCGLPVNGVHELLELLDRSGFTGPFVIEDPSLNSVEKSQRPMIEDARCLLDPFIAI